LKNSNLSVETTDVEQLQGKEWNIKEEPKGSDELNATLKNAVYQSGEGKYRIHISNAYDVNLNANQ
jgi:hypothetical protein